MSKSVSYELRITNGKNGHLILLGVFQSNLFGIKKTAEWWRNTFVKNDLSS